MQNEIAILQEKRLGDAQEMTYASAAGVKARVHLFAVDIGVIIYRNKEGGDRNG